MEFLTNGRCRMKKHLVFVCNLLALALMIGACGTPATTAVPTSPPEVQKPSPVVSVPTATTAPVVKPTVEPTATPPKKIVVGLTAGPLALDVYHDPATTSQTIGFSILEPLVIL